MSLDEATRRLAFLMQRELRRLTERERARSDRGEEVRYDSVSRMATWETRRGDVIGRWYGEILASYVVKDRILRWAWAGRASTTHAEVIFREGQTRDVAQLSMSVVGDLDEEDARTLARLGVLVAKGEGLSVRNLTEGELTFIGLFDSPRPREGDVVDPSRYSVPPPPVAAAQAPTLPPPPKLPSTSQFPQRRGSTPPPSPYRSLPPITEIYGPRTAKKSSAPPAGAASAESVAPPAAAAAQKKVREPARGLFVPVATAVLSTVAKAAPKFQQALFVVHVHHEKEGASRRLVVMLAVVDEAGVLTSIDPSDDLVEAAARMVEADRTDGNGPWRKLSARITPKADGGATLNVDVL